MASSSGLRRARERRAWQQAAVVVVLLHGAALFGELQTEPSPRQDRHTPAVALRLAPPPREAPEPPRPQPKPPAPEPPKPPVPPKPAMQRPTEQPKRVRKRRRRRRRVRAATVKPALAQPDAPQINPEPAAAPLGPPEAPIEPLADPAEPAPPPTPEPEVTPAPAPTPAPPSEADLLGYRGMLEARLLRQRRYPRAARRMQMEGEAVVLVRVLPSGALAGPGRVIVSSDFEVLDDEALRMVRAAAPFPPLPAGFREPWLEVEVPIDFSLE
jgi:protein TonB